MIPYLPTAKSGVNESLTAVEVVGGKTLVYDVLSCEEQTLTPLWLASEEVWISMYLLRKWLTTLPVSTYH